jgi:hypothetical protein
VQQHHARDRGHIRFERDFELGLVCCVSQSREFLVGSGQGRDEQQHSERRQPLEIRIRRLKLGTVPARTGRD